MPEDTKLECGYTFREIEYVLSMQVKDNMMLTVTVEDRLTANQWKGSFDSAYVEDMTHKTGNYKQFNVFVNMLESAISKSSDSVTLDLLTFNDLELLRKRKAGVGTNNIPGAHNPSLTQKRYLILTYSVEFDKIHYPLPLPYAGKPDPEILQETIRRMQQEIKNLKSQDSKDYRVRELEKLQSDYDRLLLEKEAIEREFILYRKELKNTSAGASNKEIRILKGVVKNLEEELMKEKAKHQRAAAKRRKENQDLLEEVQELRASERTLKVRVKSLTNELAVYKRKAIAAEHGGVSHRGNTSRNNSVTSYRDRSASRERSRSASRMNAGSRLTSPLDRVQSSADRRRPLSAGYDRRSASRERQLYSRTPSPGHAAQRPSPSAGTRRPRFDPTAYIEEKKRQQQTTRARSSPAYNSRNCNPGTAGRGSRPVRSSPKLRDYNNKPSPIGGAGDLRARSRSRERRDQRPSSRVRTSSVESIGSAGSARRSRLNSYSDIDGNMSDGSQTQQRRKTTRSTRYRGENSENRYLNVKKSTPNTSTPNNMRRLRARENIPPPEPADDYMDDMVDIDDIDARLQRIQAMMKQGI